MEIVEAIAAAQEPTEEIAWVAATYDLEREQYRLDFIRGSGLPCRLTLSFALARIIGILARA